MPPRAKSKVFLNKYNKVGDSENVVLRYKLFVGNIKNADNTRVKIQDYSIFYAKSKK